jgi:hypothetical protein
MNNKGKIKQRIKRALILAQQSVFITPVLEELMQDLEKLLKEGVVDEES